MFNKSVLIVVSILVIGIFLRTFKFAEVPPSLNWDEVSLGYNAYSILHTGKDEWGRVFPVSFEAFGDFKLPVYIYSLVPMIHVFDLEEWVIRLPSLLSGVLAIIFIYIISIKLTKQKTVATLATFLFAISATHIFLSRIALEANLALGLFLGGLSLFLIGVEKNRKLNFYLPAAFLLFGLTLFTYNSARLFIPIFILIIVFINRKFFLKNKLLSFCAFSIFFMFTFYAAYLAIFIDSSSRYFWVSIVDQGAINFLNESRGNSTWPEPITKLIYNKFTYFIFHFLQNYIQHFSLDFLLFEGGKHAQFSLPNKGLLYFSEAVFFLIGVIALLKKYRINSFAWVLLAWILIAPIPAAVTREAPHVLRAIFMLGALQIIIALGIFYTFDTYIQKIKKWALFILVMLLLIETGLFSYKYFFEYTNQYSQSWQYGMKEMVLYLQRYQAEYDSKPIFVTKRYGEPHIFYLFFSKYNPQNYQNNETLIRYDRTNWRWVDRLDNIYFINDWEIKQKTQDKLNSLVITSPGNFPDNAQILDSIYFLDGKPVFDIVVIGENDETIKN